MHEDTAPIDAMRRGLLWFLCGGAVIIVVHYFRVSSAEPLLLWGPLVPMFAGAYGVVAGAERMIGGFRAARRLVTPALQRRRRVLAACCAAGVVLVVGAGWVIWKQRAPYWDAVAGLQEGDRATATLRDIGQRHADELSRNDPGPESLETWRRTAAEGSALRPAFARAHASALRLTETESGLARARAENDAQYYALCLEWMDLFDRIQHTLETQSLAEPPLEWGEAYDGIIGRIQRVNEASPGR